MAKYTAEQFKSMFRTQYSIVPELVLPVADDFDWDDVANLILTRPQEYHDMIGPARATYQHVMRPFVLDMKQRLADINPPPPTGLWARLLFWAEQTSLTLLGYDRGDAVIAELAAFDSETKGYTSIYHKTQALVFARVAQRQGTPE